MERAVTLDSSFAYSVPAATAPIPRSDTSDLEPRACVTVINRVPLVPDHLRAKTVIETSSVSVHKSNSGRFIKVNSYEVIKELDRGTTADVKLCRRSFAGPSTDTGQLYVSCLNGASDTIHRSDT